MKHTLSKTQLTSICAEIVASLGAAHKMLDTHQYGPDAAYKGLIGASFIDGKVQISITKHAPYWVDASNHKQMAAAVFLRSVEDALEPARRGFETLFPGLPLTWDADERQPARHALLIGTEGKTRVIDTVLARWKAPLFRLARYLDEVEADDGEMQTWLLQITPPDDTGDLRFEDHPLRVDARSLEEAVFLSGFKSCHDAVVTPSESPERFAQRLGTGISKDELKATIAERTRGLGDAWIQTLDQANQDIAPFVDALHSCITQILPAADVSMTMDIIRGTCTTEVPVNPFVHAEDQAQANALVPEVENAGTRLVKTLSDTVKALHPKAETASITITATCGREADHHRIWVVYQVDGQQTEGGIDLFFTFIKNALHLSILTKPGSRAIYGAISTHEAQKHKINEEMKIRLVEATCPEHAGILLGYHLADGYSILEMIPVAQSEIRDARDKREAAIKAHYVR